MKKILLLMLLMITATAQADEASVIYADTVLDADTNASRTDAINTPSVRISDYSKIWVAVSLEAVSKQDSAGTGFVGGVDTVFANDTFFVLFQQSYDDINWFSVAPAGAATGDTLQTIVKGANDTFFVRPTTYIRRDSLNIGNFGRIRFIHGNTLSSEQELNGNIYRKKLTAWFSGVK